MRSRFVFFVIALASPPLAIAGCDYYVTSTSTEGPVPAIDNLTPLDDAGDAALGASAESDGTAGPTGSPLCGALTPAAAATATCDPDAPTTAKACGVAPDAQPGDTALACRLLPAVGANTASGVVQPVCAPAGPGGDGSWCKTSSECAAGYDCVGAGTCQHYCCAGNVECVTDEFCDIQPTTQLTGVRVPVCMPIQPAGGCTLLATTSCPEAQTCSVVREDGATSCVAIGAQKAGEACETAHCAADLVCLGTPGERTCFELCSTATAAQCSVSQKCKGGLPLFQDNSIGICQ